MKYHEMNKDLFMVDSDYFLAHCISGDAAMGKGIATEFVRLFPYLKEIQEMAQKMPFKVGSCVKAGRIFNLVTKKFYNGKPTYKTFTAALNNMKQLALKHHIQKIAMPQIGAGLDRLNWVKNREIIKQVFEETDIEILVCYL